MEFDLALLGDAFAARSDDWEELEVVWSSPSRPTTTPKPSSQVGVEAPGHLGDFVLWASGEAEVTVIRHSDARRMVKVYEVQTGADLDRALEELIAFLRRDEVPAGGYLWDR